MNIPEEIIKECELLSQTDGRTRFIFDKSMKNEIDKFFATEDEIRDITIESVLSVSDFYISDEEEFEIMPSRFASYDTETKLTCHWSKHRLVIDWLKKIGFEPGLSNLGPEMEQSFVFSDSNCKCIFRIQPNVFVNLSFDDGLTRSYHSFFFNKSKIIELLKDKFSDNLVRVIRDIKLEEIL